MYNYRQDLFLFLSSQNYKIPLNYTSWAHSGFVIVQRTQTIGTESVDLAPFFPSYIFSGDNCSHLLAKLMGLGREKISS